nr:hypothetical protein BgiMline_027539 [Biomphalaria glabrata]
MASTCFLAAILLTCLVSFTLSAPQALLYKTIGSCSESCPRCPDLECKLDCLEVNADGTSGTDCINHFYDANGNIFHDCWL